MKRELRKKELTQIAYELFLTKGYENTSVDEIISKAGIAKGTYYYYFESKEQTLEEVINMIVYKCVLKAKQVLDTDLPIEQKFLNVILSLRVSPEEIEFQNVIHIPENIILHKKINDRIIKEAVPLLAKKVEEEIESGLFNCDNIEERIKMILIMSNQLFDDKEVDKKCISVFIDTVEKMLGAKSGTLSFIEELIGG